MIGGSDGERERRFKGNRRSKSRDSQYSESSSYGRHKPDPALTLRNPHRTKQHQHVESPDPPMWNKNIETYKKNFRKQKEIPKNESKFDGGDFQQKKMEKVEIISFFF